MATWSKRARSSPAGRLARMARPRRSFCSRRSRAAPDDRVGEDAGRFDVVAGGVEADRSRTADSSSTRGPFSSRRTGSFMLFLNTYVAGFVPFHSTRTNSPTFGGQLSIRSITYDSPSWPAGRISLGQIDNGVSVCLEPAMTTRSRSCIPRGDSNAHFQPERFCCAIWSGLELAKSGVRL
jgi:hypothetical protein